MLAAIAAGCGSRHPAAPIRERETLVIGTPEGAAGGADSGVAQVARNLSLEGLVQLGVDGRPLGRLAAEWHWENNGLRLRVKLHPGVMFHDGTALDAPVAADVLGKAIRRPGNLALYPSLGYVTSVQPSGRDDEIVLNLSEPSALLVEDLEIPLELQSPSRGTGPFSIVENTPSEIVMQRFERYRSGLPSVARVVIRPFETLRTAWTRLLRGEVDMVTDVPPDAVEFIRNDDVQVMSFSRRYQFMIAFNSRRGPFRSAHVRRALNLAVDRETLLAKVLKGRGVASTGPIWPRYWAYDSSAGSYGFDPDQAKSLLEAAGFRMAEAGAPPARLRFRCLVPENFSVWERVALEVQKNLYAIGVDMQFDVVPFEQFDASIRDGNFEATLIDLSSGPTLGRPYVFWRSAREFRGLNVFGYENKDAERLFDLLRTSTSEAAVRSATRKLQQVFLNDPPALFLAWNERARAIRRDFVVPQEPGRDPMLTLWRWTSGTTVMLAATR